MTTETETRDMLRAELVNELDMGSTSLNAIIERGFLETYPGPRGLMVRAWPGIDRRSIWDRRAAAFEGEAVHPPEAFIALRDSRQTLCIGRHELPPQTVSDAACRHILASGSNLVPARFRELLGGSVVAAHKAIRAYQNTHGGGNRGRLIVDPYNVTPTKEDVRARLLPCAKDLTHTCLEKDVKDGVYPELGVVACRCLLSMESDLVRTLSTVHAAEALNRRVSNNWVRVQLRQACDFDRVFADVIGDQDAFDARFRAYVFDRTHLPDDLEYRRRDLAWFVYRLPVELERWTSSLTAEQAERLAPVRAPLPRNPSGTLKLVNESFRHLEVQAQDGRKDRVWRHEGALPRLRFIGEMRVQACLRADRAMDRAIAAWEALPADVRPDSVRFSYVETVRDAMGRRGRGRQRQHFTIWAHRRLRDDVVAVAGDVFEIHDDDGAVGADGPDWQVEYRGVTAEGDATVVHELWFAEAFDEFVFDPARSLDGYESSRRSAGAARLGLPVTEGWAKPGELLTGSRGERATARRARRHLGRRIIPLRAFTHGMMYGRLSLRITTVSGARTGELGQLAQNKAKTFRIKGIDGGEDRYVFMAIPKLMHEPLPFVIDADTWNAIGETGRYTAKRFFGGRALPVRPPCRELLEKVEPDRFMFAGSLHSLKEVHIATLLRVLLMGIANLTNHDLRHLFANYAASKGIPMEVIARWLNHKTLNLTRYYAKRSPAAVAESHRDFVTVVELDELRDFDATTADADRRWAADQVGSLTSVVGGTCTKLAACAARSACIDCVNNAPEPEKRDEVVVSRCSAQALLELFRTKGRARAVAEQEDAVKRHDRMLDNMDLVAEARSMSEEDDEVRVELETGGA